LFFPDGLTTIAQNVKVKQPLKSRRTSCTAWFWFTLEVTLSRTWKLKMKFRISQIL